MSTWLLIWLHLKIFAATAAALGSFQLALTLLERTLGTLNQHLKARQNRVAGHERGPATPPSPFPGRTRPSHNFPTSP